MKLELKNAKRPRNLGVALRKIAWTAVAASMVFHVLGFVALAAWFTSPKSSHIRFSGRDQAFPLTLSLAQPQWDIEPMAFDTFETAPPVVIEPHQARISKHTYIQIPTVGLSADDFLEAATDSIEPLPELATLDEVVDTLERPVEKTSPTQPQQTNPKSPDSSIAQSPAPLGNTDDVPPDLSQNAPPTYPAHAIQKGWEGTVLLRVWIDETGHITNVKVARTSGYPILDGAAATAVRQWSASPAKRRGKPMTTVELLPVRFKL